jgi:hypothetical protein
MSQVQPAPEVSQVPVFGPWVTYEFGYKGGNIAPATVLINVSGQVIPSGHVHVLIPNLRLSRDTMLGLLTLTEAEHFFELPDTIGPIGNPDAASAFITVTLTIEAGPTRKKTVVERPGGHEPRFDQLFAVLTEVSGVIL